MDYRGSVGVSIEEQSNTISFGWISDEGGKAPVREDFDVEFFVQCRHDKWWLV